LQIIINKPTGWRYWFHPDPPQVFTPTCPACEQVQKIEVDEIEVEDGSFTLYIDCDCGEEIVIQYKLKSMVVELEEVATNG